MKILTQLQLCKDIRKDVEKTCPGSPILDIFKLKFEDDGTQTLEKIGEKNIYEEIQSHKDSVDIHVILGQCMRKGDYSLLYQREGFFGDISEMPTTYAEVLQHVADAEELWKQLPAEVKEKFDNSVAKFYASAFTPEWTEKLSLKAAEPVTEPIKEEGVSNE